MSLLNSRERLVLGLARRVVPRSERDGWQREWDGELAALAQRVDGWPKRRRQLARTALRVALNDALWLRLHPRRPDRPREQANRPLRRSGALHAPIAAPGTRPGTQLWRDLVFGVRRLRRAPGFALMVVGFLSLSIASTTAVFALVRSILFEPLAYTDADRLVRVVGFDPTQQQQDWLSKLEVEMLRSEAKGFEAVAYSTVFPATWQRGDGGARIQRAFVSEDYFGLLGASAFRGRLLTAGDDDRSAVVLGYDFWRKHWLTDESVIGNPLVVDDRSFTVVGIAAPDTYTHDFSVAPADLWLRFSPPRPDDDEDFRIYTVVARLLADRDLDAARAEVLQLESRLAESRPAVYGGWQLDIRSLKETVVGGSRQPLLLLFVAFGLLMLGICANLANLVMARLLGRRSELAIHLALGGRRTVIARQLVIESTLLSVVGGGVGFVLARWSLEPIPRWLSLELPRASEVEIGWPALGFALVATAVMTLLFGWMPALVGTRAGLAQSLRADGRSNTARMGWLRNGLIVAQVAVALPLLIGASLLVRSLLNLQSADLGLRPDGLFGAQVSLPFSLYPEPARRAQFFEGLLERLHAQPGVVAAGASMQMPLAVHQQDRTRFTVAGRLDHAGDEPLRALYQVVTPGYFATLGAELRDGRDFDARDTVDGLASVIISDELRRRHFPDRNPVGERLTLELVLDGEPTTRSIVGVVENIAQLGPAAGIEPMVFVPHGQVAWPAMGVLMRLEGAPGPVVQALRADAARVAPAAIVESVVSIPDALRGLLGPSRSAALVIGAFALIAAALSLLGLYSLLSYDVSQSGRDIAIRMAVGATATTIRHQLLTRAALLAMLGAIIGLGLAAIGAHVLRAFIFGVPRLDSVSFVVAPCCLLLVALAASWLPATRAARISPSLVLRGD